LRRQLGILLVILGLGIAVPGAQAQTPASALELRLSKVNGFNLGGRIQGRFRLTVSGTAELRQVTFLVDGAPIGDATASPFGITFDTGAFEPGRHELSATATSTSGERLGSNVLTVEFVSPETARRSTLQIILPILAILLVGSVLAVVVPLLTSGGRRRVGIGEYGMAGGAVCRKCGLPFSRHFVTLRLLGARLERCPHCGKWQMASKATPEQLSEAEARLKDHATMPATPEEHEESLRRMIDDSRFEE
jgi:hypothetical protein